jgi:hypothetical protein
MDKSKPLSEEQLLAKQYIDEFQLNTLVGNMLDALIRAKSNSPEQFMINFLQSKLAEYERKTLKREQKKKKKLDEKVDNSPLKIDENSKSFVKKYLTDSTVNDLKDVITNEGVTLKKIIKIAENDPGNIEGVTILDIEVIHKFK